jgi:hypothetical protein
MHTATQLNREGFYVELAGTPAEVDDLLPNWHVADRFGIVVTEPYGGIGASLLIQLATVAFFDVKPVRRLRDTAEYPEIYLFHFGGVHGDCSSFDFWPPRKEIVVSRPEPIALLEALNAHAISRLALPDGSFGDREALRVGPSTWAEEHSAGARIKSSFAYGAAGTVPEPDILLRSDHPCIEENVNSTLNAEQAVRAYLALPQDEFVASLPGPSVPDDVRRWGDKVFSRVGEVDVLSKDTMRSVRSRMLAEHDGVSTETYRRLTVDDALRRIARM